MKKNVKKVKYSSDHTELGEPLNEVIDINIKRNEINNNKKEKEDNEELKKKKVSFCSRLFFLWTLIIMRLSNKKKLKKEMIRKSPLFTNKEEQDIFNEEFIFLKELW